MSSPFVYGKAEASRELAHLRNLEAYNARTATGPYCRRSDGSCPSCHSMHEHQASCPRLLQIAGYDASVGRLFPSALGWLELPTTLPSPSKKLDPVSRLPNEVMAKIFDLALDHSTVVDEAAICSRNYFGPNHLTQVSQGWRHLALRLVHLWSTIVLIVENSKPESVTDSDVQKALIRLQKCLDRSRNPPGRRDLRTPLTIVFRALDPYFAQESTEDCILALAQERERWHDVRLTVHWSLLDLFKISVAHPENRDHCLMVQPMFAESTPTFGAACPNQSLRPTQYIFDGSCPNHNRIYSHLPLIWVALRDISISATTTADIVNLLSQSPLVERLAISLQPDPPGAGMRVLQLRKLHRLQTLNVRVFSSSLGKFKSLIDSIVARSLTTLKVKMDAPNEFVPLQQIANLLHRSNNPGLRHLDITGGCDPLLLHPLLQGMSQLVSLEITMGPSHDSAPFEDTFWMQLASYDPMRNTAHCFPKLASLKYQGPLNGLNWRLIVTAIEARMKHSPDQAEARYQRRSISRFNIQRADWLESVVPLDLGTLTRLLALPAFCWDANLAKISICIALLCDSIDQVGALNQVSEDVGIYFSLPNIMEHYLHPQTICTNFSYLSLNNLHMPAYYLSA